MYNVALLSSSIKRIVLILLSSILTLSSLAQDGETYRIFTSAGKEVSYDKMIRGLDSGEIIFFGELHNNALAHWLELQVLKALYDQHKDMVLGMEMFEADDQVVLDEYLSGDIQEKHLLSEAKVWDNYTTDYRPLVEFAREKKLKVVATNIPRRYANMVYRGGLQKLDALSDEAKKWMAPLPIQVDVTLPGYQALAHGMSEHVSEGQHNLAFAQAVKDATMAHFIKVHKTDTNRVFHINGSYHSQNREGIVHYLATSRPSLRILTIQVVEQVSVKKLDDENKGKADFIICIPADMIRTH